MKKTLILLVEDEENDIFFFREALKELNYAGKLHPVKNCSKARAYLNGRTESSDRSASQLPDLIVSDFGLQDGTGAGFFHWLQAQPAFAGIPFVLFSQSATVTLGRELVSAGARAFITKSGAFAETTRSVKEMLGFLPSSRPPKARKPNAAPTLSR